MPAATTSSSAPTLRAIYTNTSQSNSTASEHIFSHPLTTSTTASTTPSSDSISTKNKKAHLSSLRASTKKLQEEINTFLTQKMEEDKAQQSGFTNRHDVQGNEDRKVMVKGQEGRVRDEEEGLEERYGEEDVDDLDEQG